MSINSPSCIDAFIIIYCPLSSFMDFVLKPALSDMSHFSSVAQSCPTLCDPMNRSTPGLPVHIKLLEFTQTHAH